MKNILKTLLAFAGLAMILTACDKADALPFYDNGMPVTLSALNNTIAPTIADSTKAAAVLNWSDPKYATDSANRKYIVEFDKAGNNFASSKKFEVIGKNSLTLTGKQVNNMLLSYNIPVGMPQVFDVRVTSSYKNNNEQYISNIIQVNATATSDPSVLTASNANITASLATANNAGTTFTWTRSLRDYNGQITYSLQYDLNKNNFSNPKDVAVGVDVYTKAFTIGELNDAALKAGAVAGKTDSLSYRVKAVTEAGSVIYSAPVKIKIATYAPESIYPTIYMVGSATVGDWDNSKATPMYRDGVNPFGYTYTGYFKAGSFKFISTLGKWAPMWGVDGAGKLKYRATEGDPDVPTIDIATAGYYKVFIDLNAMTYTFQSYDASAATVYPSIGIIGSFNGWSDIVPMTLVNATNDAHNWEITKTFTTNEELKFRHAPNWDVNWGPVEKNRVKLYGVAEQGKENIVVPAGTYIILFNDITGTYTFVKQ
jgi:starch-binding outer membrane protein SusE/F